MLREDIHALKAQRADHREETALPSIQDEYGIWHVRFHRLLNASMVSEGTSARLEYWSVSEISSPQPLRDQPQKTRAGMIHRLGDGFLRRWRSIGIEIASRAGLYDHWKQIDWRRVERLVFVCSGNICRSPYAEAIALARGIDAVSCGTTARGGAPADDIAIEVAARFDIDLGGHQSSPFGELNILASDLLVVMDTSHIYPANAAATPAGAQLTLLGLWDQRQPAVIRDPFGRPAEEYERCFLRIGTCMDELIDAMRQTK